MPGRDALLMNRPGWWRLYGAAGGIVLIALGCLAAGVWMLFFRDQVLIAVAVWIALTIPASERRLDEHLSRQRDAEAGRNARTLD
jgi:hypothetical protein